MQMKGDVTLNETTINFTERGSMLELFKIFQTLN